MRFDELPSGLRQKLEAALSVYAGLAKDGWNIGYLLPCEGDQAEAMANPEAIKPEGVGAVMFNGHGASVLLEFDAQRWLDPEAHREAVAILTQFAMGFGFVPYKVPDASGYSELKGELLGAVENLREFVLSLPLVASDQFYTVNAHQLALLADLKFKLGKASAACDAFGK